MDVDVLITHTPPANILDISPYNGKSIGALPMIRFSGCQLKPPENWFVVGFARHWTSILMSDKDIYSILFVCTPDVEHATWRLVPGKVGISWILSFTFLYMFHVILWECSSSEDSLPRSHTPCASSMTWTEQEWMHVIGWGCGGRICGALIKAMHVCVIRTAWFDTAYIKTLDSCLLIHLTNQRETRTKQHHVACIINWHVASIKNVSPY